MEPWKSRGDCTGGGTGSISAGRLFRVPEIPRLNIAGKITQHRSGKTESSSSPSFYPVWPYCALCSFPPSLHFIESPKMTARDDSKLPRKKKSALLFFFPPTCGWARKESALLILLRRKYGKGGGGISRVSSSSSLFLSSGKIFLVNGGTCPPFFEHVRPCKLPQRPVDWNISEKEIFL